MYLVHVSYNVGDTPQKIVQAIPRHLLPYVVLNLNPVGTEDNSEISGYQLMREWLQQAYDLNVWAMVQSSSGIRNRMDNEDSTLYEQLYKDFPNMIGYNWSEQSWGFSRSDDDGVDTFAQRLDLLSELLEISNHYGGYVYVNDAMSISNKSWNTINKFKTHSRFRETTKAHSEHFIIGNKTTHGWGYYDNESMALGAFLGGYAGHYAIRYDQYSWVWSGKAELFGEETTREEAEKKGSLTWFSTPEALMGTHIVEHLMLSGASVIDGPEVEWASAVFHGAPTPNLNNVMLDVLSKVVDGTIVIPARAEVAARTKVALINDTSTVNTPADMFTGVYKLDNDGELRENRRWLKKTGRYPTIPYMYGSPEDSGYSLEIQRSEYDSTWPDQSTKLAQLNALFPVESTGDMFVARVANNWLSYNPYMNTDQNAAGEFQLKYNSCSSIAMNYTPHTFSVIKEQAQDIHIYLNNYRTDKDPIWDQYYTNPESPPRQGTMENTILPIFVREPTDSALRESVIVLKGCSSEPQISITERGAHKPGSVSSNFDSGEYTITVQHNGPLDIALSNALGDNSDRLPLPSSSPVIEPALPNPDASVAEGIWLEAECGSPGNLWTLANDATASGMRYVSVVTAENATEVPGTEGQLTFSFDIAESGSYGIWLRVIAPSASDDSFWYKTNDGSWGYKNQLATNKVWAWKQLTTRSLNQGSNSLAIGYRENGAELDKVFIGTGTPIGAGEPASNSCNY